MKAPPHNAGRGARVQKLRPRVWCGRRSCEPVRSRTASLAFPQWKCAFSRFCRLAIVRWRGRDRGDGQFVGDRALHAAALVEDCGSNGPQADFPVLDSMMCMGLLVCAEFVLIH